jgi:hypothetical protein
MIGTNFGPMVPSAGSILVRAVRFVLDQRWEEAARLIRGRIVLGHWVLGIPLCFVRAQLHYPFGPESGDLFGWLLIFSIIRTLAALFWGHILVLIVGAAVDAWRGGLDIQAVRICRIRTPAVAALLVLSHLFSSYLLCFSITDYAWDPRELLVNLIATQCLDFCLISAVIVFFIATAVHLIGTERFRDMI